MASGGFFLLFDSITPRLNSVDELVDDALDTLTELAKMVESDARSNAPWDDRTGDARQGLTATASREGDDLVLELAHTVNYGQWLETIQSGRFAIIMPTLEEHADEIFTAIGGKMSLGGGE